MSTFIEYSPQSVSRAVSTATWISAITEITNGQEYSIILWENLWLNPMISNVNPPSHMGECKHWSLPVSCCVQLMRWFHSYCQRRQCDRPSVTIPSVHYTGVSYLTPNDPRGHVTSAYYTLPHSLNTDVELNLVYFDRAPGLVFWVPFLIRKPKNAVPLKPSVA